MDTKLFERTSIEEALDHFGFCMIPQVISSDQLVELGDQIDQIIATGQQGVLGSSGNVFGVRNLLQLWPEVVGLCHEPRVLNFVRKILGPNCGVVRALFFDKPPQRSWTLPWHRDRTIAVREIPAQLGEFTNPTKKAGLSHLVAPNHVLEQMLTLRFSIDPMTLENGPLVVVPGSHILGTQAELQTDEALAELAAQAPIHTQICDAGDLFIMRPLLAHSSLRSNPTTELRRRVVHLELASSPLPEHLVWQSFLPIAFN